MGFFSEKEAKPEVFVPQAPAATAEETGAFKGAAEAFGGAASDLNRQRALEQEQLGIQRGFIPLATNLQQTILQRLLETFSPQGLRGQAGLVGQAFQEPFRQAQEDLIGQFQSQGFDPFGTTPGAQALGRFQSSKASAIANALLQNLQFSSRLGIQPVTPFVPQAQQVALPSAGLGINLGRGQTALGGTLGQIRAATFKPQVLTSQFRPTFGSSFATSFGSSLGKTLGSPSFSGPGGTEFNK